ncbi:hypothetical protein COCC4DRAFT_207950 [Bipolaris maydis ATCC 48331]|uniref:Fe2OG dioxygenase domain-containing protein n=2 Tax=Cochliobolus heterostrophus TaxID=5016 RepID=M2TU33_COCH5|nr:uncharacterized protein COCC4DRAFT_207950 [Bipolaris maydis ATCC 48331]EMD85276.1 hypothetical protein COCHEDRAFT_1208029 [Bipolaris maydis C5]KAJ5058065.1 hypothetical protein J3E74DRAFT_436385 [Bipolaris maydis]ENH99519.1 hypothetical protein COCC4DRAFT_207950 [Bipolaris maydis ATCC 48331]KAJ6195310.1 hypothetical protein J3E72DRAFT_402107 [Bipolaris maydis]KAJ6206081.1 hypothetical protein PSV09DRAFT_1208029 [Bipolaris maydis]
MTGSEYSNAKLGLDAFRIAGLPPDFYYIPNFISVEEETSILQKIPAQRWTYLSHRRLQAIPSTLTKNNTLLASPLPVYLTTPIIDRFKDLSIFDHTPHQQPNHVLVNEYKPGQGIMPHEDGDAYAPVVATVSLGAPLCLDILAKPSSASADDDDVNTSNDAQQSHDEAKKAPAPTPSVTALPTRIFQEPRSLLVTTGSAYRHVMHGIAERETDEGLDGASVANWDLLGDKAVLEDMGGTSSRGVRVSLTYRDVLKVSAAASKVLGGLGGIRRGV